MRGFSLSRALSRFLVPVVGSLLVVSASASFAADNSYWQTVKDRGTISGADVRANGTIVKKETESEERHER